MLPQLKPNFQSDSGRKDHYLTMVSDELENRKKKMIGQMLENMFNVFGMRDNNLLVYEADTGHYISILHIILICALCTRINK